MNIFITVGVNCVVLFVMYKFLAVRLDRRITTAKVLDEMKREVGTIITELNETTDRNIELFETRIAQLKETIEQADRRLGLLKRENEKNAVTSELRARITAKGETSPKTEHPDRDVDFAPNDKAHDTNPSVGSYAAIPSVSYERGAHREPKRRTDAPAGRSGSNQHSTDRIKPVREAPNRERILDFHRQGFDSSVIAQKTGSTIGEVELVISLMQRRG